MICKSINVQYACQRPGLFAWLRDVHCVGMASWVVICLVILYFVWRVFIQEL